MNGACLPASTEARIRRELGELAATVGFRAKDHVRDVLEAANRAMARRGRSDLSQYVSDLALGKEESDAWVEEVVVQETYFFRDLAQLAWIAREVMAPWAASASNLGQSFRAWSAGCASGEEAHTVAALMLEAGLRGRATVIGTDISKTAVARARAGEYGAFAVRGEHGVRMRPYLDQVGERMRVRADVRALSQFRRGNLATPADASDPMPASATLILCRNVLLYFSDEAVALAAERFAQALAPGGVVVTAPADPPLTGVGGLVRVDGVVGVYERASLAGYAHGMLRAPRTAPIWPALPSMQTPQMDPWATWATWAAPASPTSTAPHLADLAGDAVEDATSHDGSDATAAPAPVPERTPDDDEMSALVQHRRALSLLETGDVRGALEAARKVTYLGPDLAIAHFTLALVAACEGSIIIARRSLREAERLALAADPDEELALGDGLRAADVARSSARQLRRLGASR